MSPSRTPVPATPMSGRRARLLPKIAIIGVALAVIIGLLVGFAGGPSALARVAGGMARTAPSDTPNVLLIVADDMRADGLVAMPTVRALAERGVTFSQGFVTTPMCCPSRASILTGQYAHTHNVLTNTAPLGGVGRFDATSTLATWLQAAGVRTGLVGRYLNEYESLDVPPGWDEWFAVWQSNEDSGPYFDYRATHNGERRYFGRGKDDYSTRVLARQALQFLEADRERPFFLQFASRAPHGPAQPESEDSGTYKTVDLPLPASYDEADVSDKPAYVREEGRLGQKAREEIELFRRRQLETLVGLDRAIGQLVDALRADGRLDRTWIVFTSDNGLTLGEHRLDVGKSCGYEPCIRVPLIVVPPGGLARGRTDDRVVANVDLAPTIAELMGTEPAAPIDGRSLRPLLSSAPGDGSPVEWRDALVIEQWRENPAERWLGLRTQTLKYVRYANGDQELYDLAADPDELENRANNPVYAAERTALAARLRQLIPPATLDQWGITPP